MAEEFTHADNVEYLLMHQIGQDPMNPRMRIIQNEHGLWDIALVLDGGYTHEEDAQFVMKDFWLERLRKVLTGIEARARVRAR